MNAEQLLGTVEATGRTVVGDLEAGIGTLSRMGPGHVDAVVVLVEPTPKSVEVGRRLVGLAADRSLGRVVVVANRIRGDGDLAMVADAFPDHEVVALPDDPAILGADRQGVAPLDLDPQAPAVQALIGLAGRLADGRRPAEQH